MFELLTVPSVTEAYLLGGDAEVGSQGDTNACFDLWKGVRLAAPLNGISNFVIWQNEWRCLPQLDTIGSSLSPPHQSLLGYLEEVARHAPQQKLELASLPPG